MSFAKPQVSFSSNFSSQCHERWLLCIFLSQTTHTLLKRSQLRINFWDFQVLRSKSVKFLMSLLKRQVCSSPNFVSLVSVMKDNSYVLFLSQTIYTLLKRSPLKWNFWVLRSKFVKFLKSNLKGQVDSSPNFVSLFSVIKDNSSVLFYLKQYIFCSKGLH